MVCRYRKDIELMFDMRWNDPKAVIILERSPFFVNNFLTTIAIPARLNLFPPVSLDQLCDLQRSSASFCQHILLQAAIAFNPVLGHCRDVFLLLFTRSAQTQADILTVPRSKGMLSHDYGHPSTVLQLCDSLIELFNASASAHGCLLAHFEGYAKERPSSIAHVPQECRE
ncbi:hypothetical protein Ae201684P_022124 [Aphanomyces euteiches]|uniref:Uncharacterized protein n=1 Tax=Aphanomyces euteiches TaxID=100861 RepID=A0A6G0W856_9STRA|nr:hypothetical protein Ae201684_018067 [Aphanomyces euteiches]KAH9072547.1 hypothetical protein Ae201684P_022124 [Aphanomyces euteiches]